MSYREVDQLDVPQEAKLKVLSLNTGLSGRQLFTEADPSLPPSWRFDSILDFIYREAPQVVLLQEVYEGSSLERIGNALGGQMVFSRYCDLSLTDRAEEAEGWGVAIGSKLALFDVREHYYDRTPISPEKIVLDNGSEHAHSLLRASLRIGSERFNFGTTHFTWHNQAEPSEHQLKDFEKLAAILKRIPDLVLTGDFNSPRGYGIFDRLAEMYQDNIPASVDNTFDTGVRPKVTWKLVVDGFFTSEHYLASNVRLVQGLSDHQGILGEVCLR
ncbi:MAG: endonuclease/exonuclease/phosphatase family protein [Candidatus Daviesbacteria bacterium]|nr:endonuclease/exonuclease/phosphatase family protein [Candidatus Daviesbacteria bacterium]